jgi:DNA repair protein SbcD/Mre11
MNSVRVLFLADSHLGTDLPLKPRVERRRRGHDFLANHRKAVERALGEDVDVVIHGGDVFDVPRIPVDIARLAYAPLLRVADAGRPVFIVPGNHERSVLPHAGLLRHPRIHVFDRPRTFTVSVRGATLALSGFPYERHDVRSRFRALVEATDWRAAPAAVRLLCVHHCVEGATVGPGDFTFTRAPDVIRGRDLPPEFAGVLSGHIHRHQVLTRDLKGNALPGPVLYPGSVERTSAAEIGEEKGYMMVHVDPDGGADLHWRFESLPARPMLVRRVAAGRADGSDLAAALRGLVEAAPTDAVLTVHVDGELGAAHRRVISAAGLRRLAPRTMNLEVRAAELRRTRPARPSARAVAPAPVLQLEL